MSDKSLSIAIDSKSALEGLNALVNRIGDLKTGLQSLESAVKDVSGFNALKNQISGLRSDLKGFADAVNQNTQQISTAFNNVGKAATESAEKVEAANKKATESDGKRLNLVRRSNQALQDAYESMTLELMKTNQRLETETLEVFKNMGVRLLANDKQYLQQRLSDRKKAFDDQTALDLKVKANLEKMEKDTREQLLMEQQETLRVQAAQRDKVMKEALAKSKAYYDLETAAEVKAQENYEALKKAARASLLEDEKSAQKSLAAQRDKASDEALRKAAADFDAQTELELKARANLAKIEKTTREGLISEQQETQKVLAAQRKKSASEELRRAAAEFDAQTELELKAQANQARLRKQAADQLEADRVNELNDLRKIEAEKVRIANESAAAQAAAYKRADLDTQFASRTPLQQARLAARARTRLDAGEDVSTVANRFGDAAVSQARAAASAADLLAAAQGKVASETVKADDSVRKHKQSLDIFRTSAGDAHSAARGLASGFNAMWLTWGNLAPLLAGAAISNAFVQTIKQGAALGFELETIKVLGGESEASLRQLETRLQSLAANGPYGPQQIAEGMRTLALAGVDARKSVSVIQDVLNLASVGQLSIKDSAEALVGIATAFSFTEQGFGRVGDVIAKTAALSQTSVASITESMRYASVIAEQYGVSIEDVGAALTSLARRNITGSSAGTALRNMFNELTGASDKARKALQSINFDPFVAGTKTVKPLAQLMRDLQTATANLDAKSFDNFLKVVANERGGKALSALLQDMRQIKDEAGNTTSAFDEARKQIQESYGFATVSAIQLNQTAQKQMEGVLSSLQNSLAEAFKGIEPELLAISNQLKQTFNSEEFKTSIQNLAVAVGRFTAFLVENRNTIGTLVEAYLVFRGAVLGLNIFRALGEGITSVTGLFRGLTTSTQAASAGMAAMGAATAAASSGAVAAAGRLGLFLRVLGPLGAVLGTAASAWSIYKLSQSEAVSQGDSDYKKAESYIKNLTEDLERQNKALRESIDLKKVQSGQSTAQLPGVEKFTESYRAERQQIEDKFRTADSAVRSRLMEDLRKLDQNYANNIKKLSEQVALQANLRKEQEQTEKARIEASAPTFGNKSVDFSNLDGGSSRGLSNSLESNLQAELRLIKQGADQKLRVQQELNRGKLISDELYQAQVRVIGEEEVRLTRELLKEKKAAIEASKLSPEVKTAKLEQLATEAKIIEQEIAYQDELAKTRQLADENNARIKLETDLQKVSASVKADITRQRLEYLRTFDNPIEAAAATARNQAEERYTGLLIETQEALDRITKDRKEYAESLGEFLSAQEFKILASLDSQIERRQEIINKIKEQRQASGELAAAAARELELSRRYNTALSELNTSIARGIYDSILAGFSKGKSAINVFKDAVKAAFRNFIIKVAIQPVIGTLIASVAGSLGFAGLANAAVKELGGGVIGGAAGGVAGGAAASAKSTVSLFDAIGAAETSFRAFSNDLGSIRVSDYLTAFGNRLGGQSGEFIGTAVQQFSSTFRSVVQPFATGVEQIGISLASSTNAAMREAGVAILQRTEAARNASASGAGSLNFANAAGGVVGGFAGNAAMRKFSGGYETKGAVGFVNSLGPAIGASIGNAILPGIGGAIGGFLGGVGSAINNRLFGKKVTQSIGASGIEGAFSNGGFSGSTFRDVITTTKKGLLRGGGSSTSVTTERGSIASEALSELNDQFKSITDSAKTASLILGRNLTSAIDRVRISGRFQVSTAEELKATLDRLSDEIIRQTIPAVEKFQRSGENLVQTAGRISESVSKANTASALLGKTTKFTIENAESALSLAETLGDNMAGLQSALAAFVPQSVLAERQIDNFAESVRALGLDSKVTTNITRKQFAALLEQIDLTSEAGQRELATLLELAPAVDAIIKQRESEAAAIKQADSFIVSLIDSLSGTTDAFNTADKAINATRIALFDTEDAQTRIGLEQTLAQQIADRYNLEMQLLGALSEGVQGVFASIGEARGGVADARASIIGTPLQLNAAQIREQIAANASVTNLPTTAKIDAALKKVSLQEVALADVGKAKSALPDAQNLLNNIIGDAKRVVSELDSTFSAGRVRALTKAESATIPAVNKALESGFGVGSAIRFDETLKRLVTDFASFGGRGSELTSGTASGRAALDSASGIGSFTRRQIIDGQGNRLIAEREKEVARLQALAEKEPAVVKALEAAQTELQSSKKAFADAIQQFVIDAGKAVSRLSKLREETVNYFEAQKALANLYGSSAAQLRDTVAGVRFGRLSEQEQFNQLRAQFDTAVLLSKTLTGDALVSQADKINSLIEPLLQRAAQLAPNSGAISTLEATLLSQAETVAKRLEDLAPKGFEKESIDLLKQIDTQLSLIEENTATAEKLIVDAINLSRDKTLEGLRGVVAAVRGESVTAFATGGAFTNGVVSRPTAFNPAVMGEAGPEAIMPLANVGGRLGVVASGGNDAMAAEIRALRQEVAQLRAENRAGHAAVASNTGKAARVLERVDNGDSLNISMVTA